MNFKNRKLLLAAESERGVEGPNPTLLTLRMEKGAASQGMQEAQESRFQKGL